MLAADPLPLHSGSDARTWYPRPQVGHTDYVTALAAVGPGTTPDYPHGAIVSGSRDTTVRAWDPSSGSCVQTLRGHSYQVTAVLAGAGGEIISASLDKSIKIWRMGKCFKTIEGHDAAVLCLALTPDGHILSGAYACACACASACRHVM